MQFGSTGVTIGAAEVAPALERGVIDGVRPPPAPGAAALWKDLLKYNYRFPVSYPQAVLIVNAEAFGKLPAAEQATVRKIVADAAPSITQVMRDEEEGLTQKFAADGIVVTAVPAAQVAEVGAKFPPFWPAALRPWKALARVRKALGR